MRFGVQDLGLRIQNLRLKDFDLGFRFCGLPLTAQDSGSRV